MGVNYRFLSLIDVFGDHRNIVQTSKVIIP